MIRVELYHIQDTGGSTSFAEKDTITRQVNDAMEVVLLILDERPLDAYIWIGFEFFTYSREYDFHTTNVDWHEAIALRQECIEIYKQFVS